MDGQDCECPQNVDDFFFLTLVLVFFLCHINQQHMNVETKLII